VAVNTQGSLLDGRYRVIRHLGSGGMASVLLCEDERLARQVAVKRLHADSPADVEMRFAREAKLGASLNHPNLVSVFDTTTDDEGVLIVMEYVEGEPLSRMLRRGPLRPEEVSAMVRDLGDALDHAHAQGVIHRDVKPSNVLIREDGLTKLADLGIATASDGTKITRSGIVLGTAAYMAPEQLDGRRAGPAADVYALAAIAFEALSGKRPREGRTPMEIAHKIASERVPDLRDVWPTAPKAAARVLQRGMARAPEDRPASAGEFAGELAAALEVGPEEKTAKTKTRRFGRRRSNAAAAAAPAAAAAAAASPAAAATPPARAAAAKPPARAPAAPAAGAPARAADPKPTPRGSPTAPSTASPPYATGGRRRAHGRSPLLAIGLAAVFVVLAVAIVAGAVLSGGDDEGSSPPSADRTPAQAKPDRQNEPKAKKEPKKADEAPKEAAPAAPAPQEEQPVSYDAARGAALNDEGFRLMNAGRYDEAIPKLQEAVDSFPPGTTDLTYAYALFNLGKSLRLAGRPDEAIPILEQRLKIPNQQDTVQRELDLAKQQAGES
jgi:tetratricopeptide (TPR) repeat protein